MVGLVFAVRV
jgi:hypothetical protein